MTRARDLAAFVSNADGDIKFDTDTLFIDSSANRVGISTTTVNRKLEVAGNNNAGAKANYIRITDTDTSATANNQQGGIEFYTSDSGNENVTASIENLYAGSGGGSELTFNTAPNGSSGVSERMRIDSSGNVGVGTSSPNLHGWTTAVTLNTSSNGGYEIGLSGTKYGAFALQGDGRVQLTNFTANPLTFQTDNTERMRILAGGGLTFNGDTAAANALDDYETGTFTPTVEGSSAAGTVTYTVQDGNYTKIGRMVTVMVNITINTISGMSGTIRFKGLPFSFSSGTNSGARGVISMSGVNYDPATYNLVAAYPSGGSQAVQVLGTRDNSTWVVFTTSQFTIGAGDGIAFQTTYFAD